MIREALPGVTIGFFLHIPFPSFEIFRLLHREWKKKIINGLLGADLIGFHTSEYLQHFLKTMTMVSGLDHRYREVFKKSGIVKADLFPIGIDFENLMTPAIFLACLCTGNRSGKDSAKRKSFSRSTGLTNTKGVSQRLSGFRKVFGAVPRLAWKGRVHHGRCAFTTDRFEVQRKKENDRRAG